MEWTCKCVASTAVVWLALLAVSCTPQCDGPSQGTLTCINATKFPPMPMDDANMFEFINGNIPVINAAIRPNYPQARMLTVSNCKVANITRDGFQNVAQLETLMIIGNPLRSISREIFSPLVKLLSLDLKSNQISEIPLNVFADLINLQSVSLDGNGISSVAENVFVGKNLTKVSLSENKLQSIPDQLRQLESLSYLAMDDNPLGVLSEDALKGFEELTFLGLDSCGITQIHDTAFTGVTKLNTLNLGFNGLSALSRTALEPMKGSLEEVYLEGNQLTTLEEGTLPQRLTTLKLSQNPWHCDEKLMWITKLEVREHDHEHVTCETPPEFSGMLVSAAAAALSEPRQPSRTVLAAAVAIPILIICVLLICFILYRIIQNRRKLKRGQVRYSAVYRETVESAKKPRA